MEQINFIFDFDSTIVKIESLDTILALSIGKDENKIKRLNELTKLGMEGKISFKESLSERLTLSTIDKNMINSAINTVFENITNGIDVVINNILKNKNAKVFIVSGGFVEIIEPIAEKLNINNNNIFANKFIFDKNEVVGIEDTLLLQQSGKGKIIQDLKNKKIINGKTVMIGDGYTDLETYLDKVVDDYICFCGVISRDIVKQQSKHIANNIEELDSICHNLLKNF